MSPAVDLLLFYAFAAVVALGLPFLAIWAAPAFARVADVVLHHTRTALSAAARAAREAVAR